MKLIDPNNKNNNEFSYSKQDLWVRKILGRDLFKKDSFFLDIGAYDGVTFSNTLMLEMVFSWNGICVEPIHEEYKKLITDSRLSV